MPPATGNDAMVIRPRWHFFRQSVVLEATGTCTAAGDSFDAERKMMTTLTLVDGNPTVFTKGAVEMVASACTAMEMPDRTVPLDDAARNALLEAYRTMTENGLRVMAFAFRPAISKTKRRRPLSAN